MYKKDLALNYRQWLICHKKQTNQSNQIKPYYLFIVGRSRD